MFNEVAWQTLDHYVYGLFDPAEPAIPFYIGKGWANRVFHHVLGVPVELSSDDLMSLKEKRIADIRAQGGEVIHKVLRYGMSRSEALKVEASLIDMVNHMRPGTLTNAVSGHGVAESIIPTSDLEIALNARPLNSDLPLLLIKIERKWNELLLERQNSPSEVTSADIYDAVKGDWVVGLRRARTACCVLAVARGIVRGVVVPLDWEDAGYENRKKMTGQRDAGEFLGLVGASVAHLAAVGSQNPVRYVNC